ncbi:MAG: hypothetical protein MJ009_00740 [Paludibacteraceae bacterium]|nr:hypothetical protein [Paludibacteraceae bacterium]
MKQKYVFALIAVLSGITAMAQSFTSYDAFNFTNTQLNGTARFVGVGGAMGALGGDATTMFYNPAGIGIYRSSEITASLNVHWNNNTIGNCGKNVFTTANLENVSYVGQWAIGASKGKTNGLIGISFGASYNRVRNMDKNGSYSHSKDYSKSQFLARDSYNQDKQYLNKDNFNNNAIGYRAILGYETYLTDIDENKYSPENPFIYKSYYDAIGGGGVTDNVFFTERGHIDEFAISLAGNVSDIFYLGMSFVCDFMDYRRTEDYGETFVNGCKMNTSNTLNARGTGFTYKVGFIVRPTNWLRIGGAYHTPSYYRENSSNYSSVQADLKLPITGERKNIGLDTPISSENGYINGPMKALGSIGFLLGKYGFIGIEYEWANVSGMVIKNSYGRVNTTMNEQTKGFFCDTHTARLGLEVKPIDEMSIRLGGGYTTAPMKKDEAARLYYSTDTRFDTHYINYGPSYNVTAGLGYRIGRHSLDLAYIWQVNDGNYYEFIGNDDSSVGPTFSVSPMSYHNVRNQIYLTYSVRF